jgi:hypothetical protein
MYSLLFFTTTIALLSNPIGIGAQLRQCSTEDAYCRIEGDNLQGGNSIDILDLEVIFWAPIWGIFWAIF